jgi:hypothetical protein
MSFENIIIRTLMPGIFVREIMENLDSALTEFSAIVEALEAGKSE